jgi:hypothetical protein
VAARSNLVDLSLRDFHSSFLVTGVELGMDFQACRGSCAAHEMDDGFITDPVAYLSNLS